MLYNTNELPIITCFVSMPSNEHFDRVFLAGISSAPTYLASKFTIDLVRLDREAYTKRHIEENVLRHIDVADILLADITRYKESLQPNVSVMHEIDYACGLGVPFILVGQKDTHKSLPSNLKGSILVEYDAERDKDLKDFARRLATQMEKTIIEEVLDSVRGDCRVACFSERQHIGLPRRIAKARHHVYILTTNLDYTNRFLKKSLQEALSANRDNPGFKIEILTMDPEGDVTNERAVQLGRTIRKYRNELRESLDAMREAFVNETRVEIVTYRTLPTQMTFIVDDTVVTAIVSLAQQSRDGVHFVLHRVPAMASAFLSHFRALKTLAIATRTA